MVERVGSLTAGEAVVDTAPLAVLLVSVDEQGVYNAEFLLSAADGPYLGGVSLYLEVGLGPVLGELASRVDLMPVDPHIHRVLICNQALLFESDPSRLKRREPPPRRRGSASIVAVCSAPPGIFRTSFHLPVNVQIF